MKLKALSLVAAVAGLLLPTVAQACPWTLDTFFHRTGRGLTLGASLAYASFEGGSDMVPTVDLGIGLGERVVVKPAIGMCMESYDHADSESELIYGGAIAVKLVTTGKLTVNAQSGVNMLTYEGDYTYRTIPIMASGEVAASDKVAVYFGAGLLMESVSFSGQSESDSDPAFFGGVTLLLSRFRLSGGIGAKVGDEDTDMAFNFVLNLPLNR